MNKTLAIRHNFSVVFVFMVVFRPNNVDFRNMKQCRIRVALDLFPRTKQQGWGGTGQGQEFLTKHYKTNNQQLLHHSNHLQSKFSLIAFTFDRIESLSFLNLPQLGGFEFSPNPVRMHAKLANSNLNCVHTGGLAIIVCRVRQCEHTLSQRASICLQVCLLYSSLFANSERFFKAKTEIVPTIFYTVQLLGGRAKS